MLIVAYCRPSFCYTQQSIECEGFVSAVENELLQSSVSVEAMAGRKAQDAVVFVFDRRCDPVTPLLNQWTYQVQITYIKANFELLLCTLGVQSC